MYKYFKKYLPRSFYRRALLIMILPTLVAQAFAIYMFYERHWNNVRRHLAASLAGEVTTIVSYIENAKSEEAIYKFIEKSQNLFALNSIYTTPQQATQFMVGYHLTKFRLYRNNLREQLGNDNFSIYSSDDRSHILTKVDLKNGHVLLIEVSDKRLFNSSTYIFILWMIGSTLLLTTISVIFLRNQIRPIIRLARYADNFGRGYEMGNIKLEGAKEIRQTAHAFMVMKERVSRHVRQRTEMLAGISHDLRTPLTRMKLEVSMLREKSDNEMLSGIAKDIDEMQSMVNSYLEFVRGDEGEEAVMADLGKIIADVVAKYKDDGADIKFEAPEKPVKAKVKPFRLARVVRNLLDNALKYGSKAEISVVSWQDSILIIVDDNGPGIPAAMREEVFKPFFRAEGSRNPETGGIGLGLSIVRDIVHSHGGTVELGESNLGGLRAMVRLPE